MINIEAQSQQFTDLKKGNPLQLRASLKSDSRKKLKKGDAIQVECEGATLQAILVSDPLVVVERPEEEREEVSLELRKSSSTV